MKAVREILLGRASTPFTTALRASELPAASVAVQAATVRAARPAVHWLPAGVEPRTAVLWAVLAAGVLLLGGVAWSLGRQLGHGRGTGD